MDYKIKFRLEKWGRSLLFQVLEMDKRFRRNENGFDLEYASSNRLKIHSIGSTQLTLSDIYLWGQSDLDDKVSICTFSTKSLMDLYYDKALFAIEDWSNNWEGFKEDEVRKIRKPKDGIFSFNDKIEFRLEKFECNLVFQVLSMDERFRCANDNMDGNHYKTCNGIIIGSNRYIEKYHDEIYLYGCQTNDTNLITMDYANNYDRDKKYNKILEALTDWSENWEGFSDKIKLNDGIFIF